MFIVALVLRGVHVWQLWQAPFFSFLMGDALSYDTWAQRIAAGDWIGREVFYQAPLYPYLLGLLYAIAGHDLLLVRVVQIVMGSLACSLITITGSRLFSPRAGLIAGLLLAICGPAIFFDGLVQKASLDLLLTCALLLCVVWLNDRVTIARAIAVGAVLGCLALTRENAIVLLPLLAAWLVWLSWRVRDRVWPAAVGLLVGAGVILMPVALRNLAVGGELHLTTSQGGPNFYIGNHEGATGIYVPLRSARGNAAYERQDAIDLAQQALTQERGLAAGSTLSPGEVSAYWWRRGLAWIAAHPGDWLALTARKLLLTWNAEEATDTEDLYSHAAWSTPLTIGVTLFHFGVLAPLGLLGVWLTRGRWRDLWILYGMATLYTVSVAMFFVLARYRYPLVPFLVLFAGAAIAALPQWWRSSSMREKAAAAAVAAIAAVICNWPLLSGPEMRAVTHYNIGYEMQARGQTREAIAEYRAALALAPGYALAHSNLGVLLAAAGQRDEARTHYREAIRLDPALTEALVNLAIDLAESGQHAEAIATLQRAIALDPKNASAHYNLGTALAATDRPDEARRELEAALALDPANAAAHNNLGILFASSGRVDEGIAHFRAALALRPDYQEAAANLQRAQALTSSTGR